MHREPAVPEPVGLADVKRAAGRLAGIAHQTPLVPLLAGVSVKAESLQVTGSFKFRGAYNALAAELERGAVAGVVAHSSGNHAQGVARAARMLGVPATVVMPGAAPAVKRDRARRDGATIVDVGPASDERVAVARQLCDDAGLLLLSSTEHPEVIAGQGTAGVELVDAVLGLPGIGRELAAAGGEGLTVFVPVGGGGLASGVGIAVKALLPLATVIGVEPEIAADARDSLRQGEIVRWPGDDVTRTIADGLRHTSVGPLAFAHLRGVLDAIVTVTEREIAQAIGVLAWQARLVAEPSGAVAVAAALAAPGPAAGARHTVCVLSGGNVDPRAYAGWLSEHPQEGDTR
jgi:threo-3-hydroxy-L-aspartate ammonia-lyase